MLKIAIVDDESLVRVGFQTIIDWTANGYEVQGVYRNGKEAWEAFSASDFPDVLLTDIRMPEMDGLELIDNIRKQDADMIILILSSFEEIEYYRKSIQLGVQDYIPKHLFDPDELIATLSRLTKKKAAAATHVQQDRTEAMMAETQRLIISSRALPGVIPLAGSTLKSEYPQIAERMGNRGNVYWVAVRDVPDEHPYMDSDISAMRFLLHDLMNRTEYVIPLGTDRSVFYGLLIVPAGAEASEEAGFEQGMHNLVKEWIDTVKQNLAISVAVGLSLPGVFEDSKMLRCEAERTLDVAFYEGPGIYRFQHGMSLDGQTIGTPTWLTWQDEILSFVRSRPAPAMGERLDSLKERMIMQCSPEEAIRIAKWIFKAYMHERAEDEFHLVEGESDPNPRRAAFESTNYFRSWAELETMLLQAIEEYELLAKKRSNPWLQPILTFIEERFSDNIRLEDAASIAGLNVNYFSHRFSQEAGMTFLEFLTRLRVRKAMGLMKNERLSAEEAASRVGYTNANYFVKVFKKITGITISEFKNAGYNEKNRT